MKIEETVEKSVFEDKTPMRNPIERQMLVSRIFRRIEKIGSYLQEKYGKDPLDSCQKIFNGLANLTRESYNRLEGFLDFSNLQLRFYEVSDYSGCDASTHYQDKQHLWKTVKGRIVEEINRRERIM